MLGLVDGFKVIVVVGKYLFVVGLGDWKMYGCGVDLVIGMG